MHWTDGHVWVLDKPILTNKNYFQYKYVLLDHGKIVKWESGIDRIADLDLLPDLEGGHRFEYYKGHISTGQHNVSALVTDHNTSNISPLYS